MCNTPNRLSRYSLMFCVGAALVGCEGKGGRVATHDTTRAERDSPAMYTGDMASSSDVVARALIKDMDRLVDQEFVDPNLRVWVVFGDIQNKTRSMPTSDFEYIRARIKDKVQKSDIWRDNVKYVASRRRVEDLRNREFGGGDGDVLQDGSGGGGVKRASEEHFYFLNGEAFQVARGTTNLYYVSFNLMRADDGAEIFSQEYEIKYAKE